jgi:hypothetical protein
MTVHVYPYSSRSAIRVPPSSTRRVTSASGSGAMRSRCIRFLATFGSGPSRTSRTDHRHAPTVPIPPCRGVRQSRCWRSAETPGDPAVGRRAADQNRATRTASAQSNVTEAILPAIAELQVEIVVVPAATTIRSSHTPGPLRNCHRRRRHRSTPIRLSAAAGPGLSALSRRPSGRSPAALSQRWHRQPLKQRHRAARRQAFVSRDPRARPASDTALLQDFRPV